MIASKTRWAFVIARVADQFWGSGPGAFIVRAVDAQLGLTRLSLGAVCRWLIPGAGLRTSGTSVRTIGFGVIALALEAYVRHSA